MKKAFVIFDRDGTLIEHVHHLVDPELVEIKKGLASAVLMLNELRFRMGIVSNQSVIGRGLATESQVVSVNTKIRKYLNDLNLDFDFIYFCPHRTEDSCKCRKPEIGLGLKAVREHNLDPCQSYVIGDQDSDMVFGKALGCRTIQLKGKAEKSLLADYYSESLEEAAKWISADVARKGV